MEPDEPQYEVPYRDDVMSALGEHLDELRFAYVFGSAAAARLRPQSDYDIAVDAGRRLGVEEVLALSGHLESVVGRVVDLVDILAAGPILKMQILQRGQLILCRDQRALAEFKMYTPSLYEDWKLLRRPIDEALIGRIRS